MDEYHGNAIFQALSFNGSSLEDVDRNNEGSSQPHDGNRARVIDLSEKCVYGLPYCSLSERVLFCMVGLKVRGRAPTSHTWHRKRNASTSDGGVPFYSHNAGLCWSCDYLNQSNRISAIKVRSELPVFSRPCPQPSGVKVTSPTATGRSSPLSLYAPSPDRI